MIRKSLLAIAASLTLTAFSATMTVMSVITEAEAYHA